MIVTPDAPELAFQTGVTKVWSIIVRISTFVTGFIVLWASWMTQVHFTDRYMLGQIDERVRQIENNRFTDADGYAMERRIFSALPPEWLKEDVSELKDTMKDVVQKLARIEAKLNGEQ